MRRIRHRAPRAVAVALALGGALVPRPAGAVQPDEVLPQPGLEQRARVISEQLRCLVCQNQSIDDSDAPLARDLRLLVRERLQTGASDREVEDFVVARYGEFVLLRPVVAPHTWLLWFGPPFVLALGIAGLAASRRRRPDTPPRPLDADEEARLRALTGTDPSGRAKAG